MNKLIYPERSTRESLRDALYAPSRERLPKTLAKVADRHILRRSTGTKVQVDPEPQPTLEKPRRERRVTHDPGRSAVDGSLRCHGDSMPKGCGLDHRAGNSRPLRHRSAAAISCSSRPPALRYRQPAFSRVISRSPPPMGHRPWRPIAPSVTRCRSQRPTARPIGPGLRDACGSAWMNFLSRWG